ncbi:MAG: type IV pilus modification protein PilV [Pseudomonadales bacterium]|nr:type IV pilus modification protein PilV [Pseudomonadales bacterium]
MKVNMRRSKGVSLIEVLVALLILGVGVMGFAALQMRAVETTNTTYSRTQAMAVARDVIERINANPSAWPLGYAGGDVWGGNIPQVANPCIRRTVEDDPDCDAAAMAAADVNEIRQITQRMLFGSSVLVQDRCRNQQVACVVVAWEGANPAVCDPDLVSIGEDVNNENQNANCVIVEFWPQQAIIAAVGGGE